MEDIITIYPTIKMDKIQSYLNGGYTVRFSEGIYNITKILFVSSNTKIIIDKGAILVRKNPSHIFRGYVNPKIDYNYDAVQNITISGEGTLIGNGVKKIGSILGFMHGQNITIENIKIKGVYKSHGIDLSACKNVTIQKVEFSKRIIDITKNYKEEIQIDYAMSAGFPYFNKSSKCYNDNHCEDINIIDCKFYDANYCIGTHTETNSSKKHKNIQIINCTANGCVVGGDGTFAKIINTDGAIVKGNKIKGFNRGIEVNSCGQFHSPHGMKYTEKPQGKTGCNDITIEYNDISDAAGNAKAAGIYVSSQFEDLVHSKITIRNNKLRLNNMSAKYDIYVDHAENVDAKDNDAVLDERTS